MAVIYALYINFSDIVHKKYLWNYLVLIKISCRFAALIVDNAPFTANNTAKIHQKYQKRYGKQQKR